MAKTLTTKAFKAALLSLDPAEIQAYIDIGLEVLIEVEMQRGMTPEQLRERRQAILDAELKAIDAELAKLPPTN